MNQEFYIGDNAYLEISSGVFCEVRVNKVNHAYGKIRYTVEPVAGKGEIKTEKLSRIKGKRVLEREDVI